MTNLAKLSPINFPKIESDVGVFPGQKISDIVAKLFQTYLFPMVGILLLLYLLLGGFQLMYSAGDPKKVEAAKGKITNAVIGFVVVFLAYWIVGLLGDILNIKAIKDIF